MDRLHIDRITGGSAALVHINRSQSYRNLDGTFLLLLPSSRRSEAWRDHMGAASVSQRAGVARRLEAPRFLFCGDGRLMGVGTGVRVGGRGYWLFDLVVTMWWSHDGLQSHGGWWWGSQGRRVRLSGAGRHSGRRWIVGRAMGGGWTGVRPVGDGSGGPALEGDVAQAMGLEPLGVNSSWSVWSNGGGRGLCRCSTSVALWWRCVAWLVVVGGGVSAWGLGAGLRGQGWRNECGICCVMGCGFGFQDVLRRGLSTHAHAWTRRGFDPERGFDIAGGGILGMVEGWQVRCKSPSLVAGVDLTLTVGATMDAQASSCVRAPVLVWFCRLNGFALGLAGGLAPGLVAFWLWTGSGMGRMGG